MITQAYCLTISLKRQRIEPKLSQIFHISAPDATGQPLLWKVFLNRVEDNTKIADLKNGKKIDTEGKFVFIPSDDLMADRDIKSVNRIEVIDLKRTPNSPILGSVLVTLTLLQWRQ